MTSISQLDNLVEIIVDKDIYNDEITSKVLYWLSGDFIITREKIMGTSNEKIMLSYSNSLSKDDFKKLKARLSRLFIDQKTREIVRQETHDIRNILYVKAFANSDSFVEFDFSNER